MLIEFIERSQVNKDRFLNIGPNLKEQKNETMKPNKEIPWLLLSQRRKKELTASIFKHHTVGA